MPRSSTTFKPGNKFGVKGRPKGIIDKRMRLNKALMGNADALLAVATAKALEGDPQVLGLLLSRIIPTLKPEGSPVRFALDASLPTSKLIEQVVQCLADGALTVEEAKQVADMIRLLAEARATEGAGEEVERLAAAFKDMARSIAVMEGGNDPQPDAAPGACPTP